jgi:methyl-accepting chemotaxis protein
MRLTLGKKLGLGFGAVLSLMICSTVLGYLKSEQIRQAQARFMSLRVPTISALKDFQKDLNQAQSKGRQATLAGTQAARREEAQKLFNDAWEDINKDVAALDALAPNWSLQVDRDRLAEMKEQLPKLRQAQQSAMKFAASGAADAVVKGGNEFADQATPSNEAIKKTMVDLADANLGLLQKEQDSMTASDTSLVWTLLLTSLSAIVVGTFVAMLLGRNISRATGAALERAEAIAGGDLTGSDIEIMSRDELGDLAAAINKMQASLKAIIESVLTSTERLASASEEISASATQQAAGSDSQKDQTHQVATAMQEMSSTVVQISENSTKAAEAAKKASETAREGGKIVEDTLGKMREIANSVGDTARKVEALGKSSDQIGQIIGVIDDIADQTNLLALNAAIEAARAGEQGRGFAVVADEVRKLAERTSKATKEIAGMIKSIQEETKSAVVAMESGTKQVEQGVQTTTQAGSSLHQIIQSAEQVGDMVTHIATAATQQSSATEEVNANIEQIAKITAETADGAQQSAKACHDLSSLALDLQNVVSQFKLSTNGRGMERRAAAPAKARLLTKPALQLRPKAEEEPEEAFSHSH